MTQKTMECAEARVSLGVYVVGAIDPAERSMVDAHLATCRDCRDELAGLAGLPALLARVSVPEATALATADGPPGTEEAPEPADEAKESAEEATEAKEAKVPETEEPPRELLATVLDLTSARRRRRRLREAAMGVAAALIIAAGVFSGIQLGTGPSAGSGSLADPHANVGPASGPWKSAAGSTSGMAATVAYRPTGWGTQFAVKVHDIPMGTACKLEVVGADGSTTVAGGWVTDSNEGTVWYPASAGIPTSAVHQLKVTVGATNPKTIVVNT